MGKSLAIWGLSRENANSHEDFIMSKEVIHTALIALAAFAVVSIVQTKVMKVPVIGDFLPGA